MSMTFLLVRHAIKERAIGDVIITDEGIKQAELTAKRINNGFLGAFFSYS
jgi:hypothetical protein